MSQNTESTSFFKHHMSLITNLIAALVFAASFLPIKFAYELRSIGLFALSGALTNWLAVHMLFEKVPGLYGSGVIVLKFQEFKRAIHSLIMKEFFNDDHLNRFFANDSNHSWLNEALESFAKEIDYEEIYNKLVQSILDSSLGTMLAMFGGASALDPMKPQLLKTIQETVEDLLSKAESSEGLRKFLSSKKSHQGMKDKIEGIIEQRLEELTPKMVKEIIERMIKEHLGWLVLWGGVFGGLIGLASSLV